MTASIGDSLIRVGTSSLAAMFCKVTAILAVALVVVQLARRSRAAVRHLWLLAAFVALALLPVVSALALSMRIAVPVGVPVAMVSMPVADAVADAKSLPAVDPTFAVSGEPVPSSSISFSMVLEIVWALGAAALLVPVVVGLWQVRSLRRAALPWP